MPAASLWAAVPHYVAVAPNPKGALALVRRLESLVGVTVDATELEDAADDYERQVSRAVELDPDVQAFVERLERAADEEDGPTDPRHAARRATCSPREFQRFLRQRGTRAPPSVDSDSTRSALGRRAGDPVVAHRARRPGRRRLEALGLDALGDLEHGLRDPVAVLVGALDRAPSRRRARSSRTAGRPRAARPRARRRRRARAGRPRAAAPRSSGGRSCSRSARSRRRAAGRRGRRGRAAGAGRAGTGRRARTTRARRPPRGSGRGSGRATASPCRGAGAPPRSRRTRRGASRPRAGRAARAAPASRWPPWKRSSTWWTRIPKRWLIVGSLGIRKTRANLYFSGQVR